MMLSDPIGGKSVGMGRIGVVTIIDFMIAFSKKGGPSASWPDEKYKCSFVTELPIFVFESHVDASNFHAITR